MDSQTITIHIALILLYKTACLLVGFGTIYLGYKLIKAGATGEFKLLAEYDGAKGSLQSLSPGICFVVLGIVMVIVSICISKGIELETRPSDQTKNMPKIIFPKNDTLK